MTELIGKTLGKYQIVARVGRGGMARVYKAYHTNLDRYVAVKVLHGHLAEEPDFVQRFEREATAVARLRHPNIVQVYDYDIVDGQYFIVMEFVEGPTLKAELSERLKRRESEAQAIFDPEEVARIVITLADAIDYAHSRGMIHRDLKPGNIMFTAEGQVLLTDFGLARMVYASRHSQTGALSGTPAYMAPEQVQGKHVGEQADVYSLGVIVYEMLTGHVPFEAETPYTIMTRHVTDPVPSPRQHNPEISPAVEAVILRALGKEPEGRHGSATELAADLQMGLGVDVAPMPVGGVLAPVATLADSQEMMASSIHLGISTSSPLALESPYRGLYAFREEDEAYFFGREAFTDRLVSTLDSKSMAAVIGPSGSGKSSVVFAGLLPRLRRQGSWTIIESRPGSRPFYSLAGALLRHLEPDLSETGVMLETKRLAEALRKGGLTLSEVLARIADKSDNGHRQLLVIDQFEELYTLCTEEAVRHRFPNALFEAAHRSPDGQKRQASLVLTLRADFMSQALADRPFADALQDADVKLGPMTRAELGRAIESPAAKKSVVFEAGLVDRILDDVGDEPGNLPLLEFALTLLWERRTGRRMTHAAYDSIGRVEGSLARYADEIYEQLSPDEQQCARRLFVQMVRPGEGTEDTRRLATRRELGEREWALAQQLADARLVVTGRTPDGEQTVEVVHEALIRGWTRLQEWMNAERSFRAWQERLRVALRQWENSDQDEGALLRGVPLGEAEEWLRRQGRDLSDAERSFIQTSIDLRERRAAEREEQRKRELEAARQLAEEQQRRAEAEFRRAEDQARSTRRLRGLAIILTIVFIGAVIAAIVAVGQSQTAENQANARATEVVVRRAAESSANASAALAATREGEAVSARDAAEAERARANQAAEEALQAKGEAESQRDRADMQARLALARQLAAQSATLLGPQLDLGLLLSLEANNINDSAETTSGILTALQASPALHTYLRGHPGIVQSVDFSPDGNQLATVGAEGTAYLWDLSTNQLLREMVGHDEDQLVNEGIFSPDGQTLFTASDDQKIILWDVNTGERLRTFEGHSAWVQAIALSPDGTQLVSAGGDREVLLWDVDTGEVLRRMTGHSAAIWDVDFSPDGRRLASGSADGTVIIWDAASGERLRTLTDPGGGLFAVAFSPDSRRVAFGGVGNNILVGDVESGEITGEPLSGHSAAVVDLAYSPDGQTLASGAADSTVRIWDATSGQQLLVLANHNAGVNGVGFSADGNFLASADVGGLVIVWEPSRGSALLTHQLEAHQPGVNNVDFHPDGDLLATAGADSLVRFWDPASGLESGEPITHGLRITEPVGSLALSQDGRLLASASDNGTIMLWDVGSGEVISTPISTLPNGVGRLALSPDGTQLVAGSKNSGFATLWDTTTSTQVGPFLTGHVGPVNAVAFSPDGEVIVSGGADGTIVFRSVANVAAGQGAGVPITHTLAGTEAIRSLAFSPDGTLLASGNEAGEVVLWEGDAGEPMERVFRGHEGGALSLAISPDGRVLAVGSGNGHVRLWDLLDDEPISELSGGPAEGVSGLVFGGDGTLTGIGPDASWTRWDVPAAQVLERSVSPVRGETSAAILGPEGDTIAYANRDNMIYIRDLAQDEVIAGPLLHATPFLGNVSTVAFSPGGDQMATAGFDGAIVLWDTGSRQPLGPPLLGHSAAIVNTIYSPDGRYLASGSCSQFNATGACELGEVILWDLTTRQSARIWRETVNFTQALAFSPDGTTLAANDCEHVDVNATCLEGSVRLWDVESGETIGTWPGHAGFIWTLAYSPDGGVLASGSADNTIILWDTETGLPIGQRLTNHGGPVRRVAFDPEGRTLVSGGLDNLVFLWDVASGQALGGPLAVHTNPVIDVAFGPDGRSLASASADGTVGLWDVDKTHWRELACSKANRNLRPEEWSRFLGDTPYLPTCPLP